MKKSICLLLAVLLLPYAASAEQYHAVVDETAASDGTYLVAVNTNPSPSVVQQTAEVPAANTRTYAAAESTSIPDNTRAIIETAGGTLYEIEPNRSGIQPFSAQTSIQTTLLYANDVCEVYLEVGAHPDLQFTEQTAQQLADYYRDNICRPMQQAFEELPDQSNKLKIMCYDIQDNFDAADNTKWSYIAGQFSPSLYRQGHYAIELDTYPAMSFDTLYPDEIQPADVTKSYGTLAHEFQHLLNYCAYDMRGDRSKPQMALWLNECFSECANEIQNPAYSSRIANAQNHTVAQDLAAGLSLTDWQGKLGNYTLSYLFGQYLRTQTKGYPGGGNEIYKKISTYYYAQPGDEMDAIAAAMTEVTGETWTPEELLFCFRVALVAQQSSGRYGFGGEDKFRQYFPACSSGAVSLPGGGATVFACPEGFRVPAATDGDIHYCVVTPPDITVARAEVQAAVPTLAADGKTYIRYQPVTSLTQDGLRLYTDFTNFTAQTGGPVLYAAIYRGDALLYVSRTHITGSPGANSLSAAYSLPADIQAAVQPGDTLRVLALSSDGLRPYLQTVFSFKQPSFLP